MSAKTLVAASLLAVAVTPSRADDAKPAPDKPQVETILFIRHGEKPPAGLGQLSCKGLNRALALPAVLKERYGHIDAVFAPNPAHQKPDGPQSYDYIRPLATVEPTAIAFALPIHSAIGYDDTEQLSDALTARDYHNATLLVAWEHHALDELVPALLAAQGGDGEAVPDWPKGDFDSIWRVTIERSGATTKASFAHEHQRLDGQPDLCPNAAAPPLENRSPLVLEHK